MQSLLENAFSTGAQSNALDMVSCNFLIFLYFCISSGVPFKFGPVIIFEVSESLLRLPKSKKSSGSPNSNCSATVMINFRSSSSISTGLVNPEKKALFTVVRLPTLIPAIYTSIELYQEIDALLFGCLT